MCVVGIGGWLTSPSKMPSPVVAQLGSTFHTWSFAILSNCRRSETSFGRIATMCQSRPRANYACIHTSLEILLVRKHQQQRVLHFPILNNPCEFCPRLVDAVAVVGIDDEDETLSSCGRVSTAFPRYSQYRGFQQHGETRAMARELAYPEPSPRDPTYQRSSVSTAGGSCPGRRHPRR